MPDAVNLPSPPSGKPTDPHELARLVRALVRAERDFAHAVAADLGTGATDLLALGDLLAGEPAGVTELGRRLGLGSAAATGLADRLEAAGHVERRPHPSDRRRLVLVPTDAARERLWAHVAPLGGDVARLAGELPVGKREAVARFLEAVVAAYAARSAATRAGALGRPARSRGAP